MSRIVYTGALSSLTLEEIDTHIDTKIRSIYRQASNNIDNFPNALLTISIKRGGLGIPSAALHINIHKHKIIIRYLASHGYSFALIESIILKALYRQGCSTPNCKYAVRYYHVHKNVKPDNPNYHRSVDDILNDIYEYEKLNRPQNALYPFFRS
jgi:hypothetical protein